MKRNFRTYKLAINFYRLAQSLVCQRHLKEQLLRAASSIVLNLVEGRGKPTVKDQRRFFSIAFGSLRECQAILELANLDNSSVGKELDVLAAHLYKLIKFCEQ